MEKVRGRPFQPGNKAGRGRPKGSRNKKTLFFQSLLNEYGEPLLMTCITKALEGDRHAIRLCVERLLAPRREGVVSLALPPVRTALDLDVVMRRLMRHIASGEVSPAQGEAVARVLENHRRILEAVDLQTRIEKLEQQANGNQDGSRGARDDCIAG